MILIEGDAGFSDKNFFGNFSGIFQLKNIDGK
jgi:hypothetical protein